MYNHELVDSLRATCKKSTREENDRLYKLMLAGDQHAADDLITGNLALAIFKVGVFLKRCPQYSHLQDDLISQGFLGVVKAVNGLLKNKPKQKQKQKINPTGYIAWSIHNHIINFLRTNGCTVSSPSDVEILIEDDSYEDLYTLIFTYCKTPLEHQILDLRLLGYKLNDIANITSQSPATTKRRWKKLRTRITRNLKNF